jgi:uncharacterized protein YegP (UPF0339 family)
MNIPEKAAKHAIETLIQVLTEAGYKGDQLIVDLEYVGTAMDQPTIMCFLHKSTRRQLLIDAEGVAFYWDPAPWMARYREYELDSGLQKVFGPEFKVVKRAKFQIETAKDGRVHFKLLAVNGEVILTSQMYVSEVTAKKGIASVQANAAIADQFEGKRQESGKHYFVLKSRNRHIIGTGVACLSKAKMKNRIRSVMKHAPMAKIEDLTEWQ